MSVNPVVNTVPEGATVPLPAFDPATQHTGTVDGESVHGNGNPEGGKRGEDTAWPVVNPTPAPVQTPNK